MKLLKTLLDQNKRRYEKIVVQWSKDNTKTLYWTGEN
jgi:hypothetical protein